MGAPAKLGVIGSGKMAEALLRGWFAAGKLTPHSVVAADPDRARRELFEADLGVGVTADSAKAARGAEALLIAVKPQDLTEACRPVAEAAPKKTLVISIAAGVTLAELEALLGAGRPIVRVMPNIAHTVQEGAAGLCGNAMCSAEQMEWVLELFGSIGLAQKVDEELMDAVTGLSGSGPAFVAVFLEALADGGVAAGLPRSLAMALAAQTALGTAKCVLQGHRPGELKELVASPGGTTIAGLRAVEAGGLRSAVMEAIIAATEQSRELGERKRRGKS
jgi:pyrroline-5-carboxylate reductase